MIIKNYNDFVNALLDAGFSMGGSNGEKVFSLAEYHEDGIYNFDSAIVWHTEDPETDPWEWRMRVLDERDDIAYAKVFFKKSGFITKEWYPYFYAVRRGNKTLEEEYNDGKLSIMSKNIYEIIKNHESLPYHVMKQLCAVSKEDNFRFERAVIDLQMKLYITMCGRQRKISTRGEEYGWSSSVFCTVENFFSRDVYEKAAKITKQEAVDKITKQIYRINPAADVKKVMKFING